MTCVPEEIRKKWETNGKLIAEIHSGNPAHDTELGVITWFEKWEEYWFIFYFKLGNNWQASVDYRGQKIDTLFEELKSRYGSVQLTIK